MEVTLTFGRVDSNAPGIRGGFSKSLSEQRMSKAFGIDAQARARSTVPLQKKRPGDSAAFKEQLGSSGGWMT